MELKISRLRKANITCLDGLSGSIPEFCTKPLVTVQQERSRSAVDQAMSSELDFIMIDKN